MVNTAFVDDRFILEGGKIFHKGIELPASVDLLQRAKEQVSCHDLTLKWSSIPYEDDDKIRFIYAFFSPAFYDKLSFYDKLCNSDRYFLANKLENMSLDDKHFDPDNRRFFLKFSELIRSNLESAQQFIDEEMDLQLVGVAEEFFHYNIRLFTPQVNGIKK